MDAGETSSTFSPPDSRNNSDIPSSFSDQESSSQASQPSFGTSTGDDNDDDNDSNSERYTEIRVALLEAEASLFGYSTPARARAAVTVGNNHHRDEVDGMAVTGTPGDASTATAAAHADCTINSSPETGRFAEQRHEEVGSLHALASWC